MILKRKSRFRLRHRAKTNRGKVKVWRMSQAKPWFLRNPLDFFVFFFGRPFSGPGISQKIENQRILSKAKVSLETSSKKQPSTNTFYPMSQANPWFSMILKQQQSFAWDIKQKVIVEGWFNDDVLGESLECEAISIKIKVSRKRSGQTDFPSLLCPMSQAKPWSLKQSL